MRLKIHLILFIFLLAIGSAHSQTAETLDLKDAYSLLEKNHPLMKNEQILQELASLENSIIKKNNLPQFALKATGRYQSESVSLDLPPGSNLPFEIDMPLYSAKSYLDLKYSLYDGGYNKALQKNKEAEYDLRQSENDLQLFKLKGLLNELILRYSLSQEQQDLMATAIADITIQEEKLKDLYEEGVVLKTEVQEVEVMRLEWEANKHQLEASLTAQLQTISFLLGKELTKSTVFILPQLSAPFVPKSRPAYTALESKQIVLKNQESLINAQSKPKLGLYGQAGYGYPNPLNFLENSTAAYGLVGINFSWAPFDWGKSRTQLSLLDLNKKLIDQTKQSFLIEKEIEEKQYLAKVETVEKAISTDRRIIELKEDILKVSQAQLDEGIITAADHLLKTNALLRARQQLKRDEMELKKLEINHWYENGNYE